MDLSQALATFFEESRDLLTQMEEILLRAEGAALDADDMNALFRCAHTIKGSAGMFGLDPVVHFTHDVENALDRLRRGELEFSADLANLLLESRDHSSSLLTSLEAGNAFDG
jgi:two-component system chemotaxis sensor kinase CheA